MGDKMVNDEMILDGYNYKEKRICLHAFQIAAVKEYKDFTEIQLDIEAGRRCFKIKNNFDEVLSKKHQATGAVQDEMILDGYHPDYSLKRVCLHAFQIAAVKEYKDFTEIQTNKKAGAGCYFVKNTFDDVMSKKHQAMGLKSKDSKPGMK